MNYFKCFIILILLVNVGFAAAEEKNYVLSAAVLKTSEPATELTPAIKKYQEAKYGIWAYSSIVIPMKIREELSKKYPGKNLIEVLMDPNTNIPMPYVEWNAEYNVPILKAAGIGYIYFVAREGDTGRCQWKSKYVDCDFEWLEEKYGEQGKKLLDYENGALAKAIKTCAKYGVLAGLNFNYQLNAKIYKIDSKEEMYKTLNNMLGELMTHYKPLASIFYTGVGTLQREPDDSLFMKSYREAYNIIKSAQPDCLVSPHARYWLGTAFPADIIETSELPPENGWNPWQKFGSKTYYVCQQTWAYMPPECDLESTAIVAKEMADRGGHAMVGFGMAPQYDEQGRFIPEYVERIKEFGNIIKSLKPNLHQKISGNYNKEDFVIAEGKGEVHESIKKMKEHAEAFLVSKYRAIVSAENELLNKIKLLKTENGETVENNEHLKKIIEEEIQKAYLLKEKMGDKGYSYSVTLGVNKSNLEKKLNVNENK